MNRRNLECDCTCRPEKEAVRHRSETDGSESHFAWENNFGLGVLKEPSPSAAAALGCGGSSFVSTLRTSSLKSVGPSTPD